MSHITPPQLKDVALNIKQAIDSGSDLVASLHSSLGIIYKGSISKAELNEGAYLKDALTLGIRTVVLSGTKDGIIHAVSISFGSSPFALAEILIGGFKILDDGLNVGISTYQDFNKKPGIAIGVRFKVITNMFDKNIVQSTGLSKWLYIPFADYEGFLFPSGGSDASCQCKTWKGSQADYDAITTKDPDTIYYITE